MAAAVVPMAQLLAARARKTEPMMATDAGRLFLTAVAVAVTFMVWVFWRFWKDSQR